MSNITEHAKREFLALGYKTIEDCDDDPNKWIQESVLELLEVFSKQGHSGFSAPYAINMFKKLAGFEPLCPIMGTEEEWCNDVYEDTDQNIRCSALFREKKKDVRYIDAITFQGEDSWDSFSGSVEGVNSSQNIKGFPFTPKRFTIHVYRELYDKDVHGEDADAVSCGDGDYVYLLKDHDELDEVWEYYQKS